MGQIQLNLSEAANRNVMIYMAVHKLTDKRIAAQKILEEVEWGDFDE